MLKWNSLAKGFLAFTIGLAVAIFGATSAGTIPYNADIMASWAQAVGSVAAIVWAGKVANDQMTAQRLLQEHAARMVLAQRLESFIALCDVAMEEVGIPARLIGDEPDSDDPPELFLSRAKNLLAYAFTHYEPKTFEGLAAALNAFPIHELPNADAVGLAQRFRDGFMHANKAISTWIAAVRKVKGPSLDEAENVIFAFNYLKSQVKALKKSLTSLKTQEASA